MAELKKAELQKVKADKNQTPYGVVVPVQFNPTSLKLKLTNQSSGGRSRGQQVRQNNGQGSTVLSMDLIFDSADEGTEMEPVSVREKTSLVEQFVLPEEGSSKPPPLLRFQWDQLIIVGIVESLEINFDHFAANGAPLRAKMGLSIKEQEPKYAYLKVGPGKKTSDGATNTGKTSPGEGTNGPGNGSPGSDRSDTAMDGETAPDFLARQGLDPSAWRGLDVDLSAGLSLEAGIEVGFSAGLSAGLGVGVSVGVMADVDVSLEASLGFSASAVLSAGAGLSTSIGGSDRSSTTQSKKIDGHSAGLALSAAGGIQSAIETVKTDETQSVAAEAQSAFGMQASSTSGLTGNLTKALVSTSGITSTSTLNRVSYMPLASSQGTHASGALMAVDNDRNSVNAMTLPKADPRSTSYGYGVPLRPLYATALNQEQIRLCNRNNSGLRDDSGPAFRTQKTSSPWVALPQRDRSRTQADQAESKREHRSCCSNSRSL